MRLCRLFLALPLVFACAAPAWADDYAFGFNPRTGDAWFDARLGDINVMASGNLDGFIDEVVVSTRAPRHWVETLVVERRYAPADVYMLAECAYRSGTSYDEALRIYERHHGEGWGAMAKRMGIKPGSPDFHALKQGSGRVAAIGADRGGAAPGKAAPAGKSQGKGQGKGKNKNKD